MAEICEKPKPKKFCYLQPPVRKAITNIMPYKPSFMPLASDTVTSLSYQPIKVSPKVTPPWAIQRFLKPSTPMASDTIYKTSYQLPGTFEECDEA